MPLLSRTTKSLLIVLTVLIVVSSVLATFFFLPRPVSASPASSPAPSVDRFIAVNRTLTWQFTYYLTLDNPNYAALSLPTVLLFFSLPPPAGFNTTAERPHRAVSQPRPPPVPECEQVIPLGSVSSSPSVSISGRSSADVEVSDRFVGEAPAEAMACMSWACAVYGRYQLMIDAVARVQYLQVEGDVVAQTATAHVVCPAKSEEEEEQQEEQQEGQG